MLLLGEKVAGGTAVWGSSTRPSRPAELDAAGEAAGPAGGRPDGGARPHQAAHAPGLTTDIDRHLADEAWAMEMSSRSEDFKEYGQAAREKRDPDFEGR